MTAAPADAPIKMTLAAEWKPRALIDGTWAVQKRLAPEARFDPRVGTVGTYAEISAIAVALNELQKAEDKWEYLYFPDVHGAKPIEPLLPKHEKEIDG